MARWWRPPAERRCSSPTSPSKPRPCHLARSNAHHQQGGSVSERAQGRRELVVVILGHERRWQATSSSSEIRSRYCLAWVHANDTVTAPANASTVVKNLWLPSSATNSRRQAKRSRFAGICGHRPRSRATGASTAPMTHIERPRGG
jgi:hypothetical protein